MLAKEPIEVRDRILALKQCENEAENQVRSVRRQMEEYKGDS